MPITLSNQVKPSDDVLFQEVGGEGVLLSLSSESYFGLDPVATRIWLLLAEKDNLRAAFEVLQGEYDVTPEQLETDLLELVEKLAEAELVQVA